VDEGHETGEDALRSQRSESLSLSNLSEDSAGFRISE
jgi:hypothetical protein